MKLPLALFSLAAVLAFIVLAAAGTSFAPPQLWQVQNTTNGIQLHFMHPIPLAVQVFEVRKRAEGRPELDQNFTFSPWSGGTVTRYQQAGHYDEQYFWTDTSVAPGVVYTYSMAAKSLTDESPWSPPLRIAFPAPIPDTNQVLVMPVTRTRSMRIAAPPPASPPPLPGQPTLHLASTLPPPCKGVSMDSVEDGTARLFWACTNVIADRIEAFIVQHTTGVNPEFTNLLELSSSWIPGSATADTNFLAVVTNLVQDLHRFRILARNADAIGTPSDEVITPSVTPSAAHIDTLVTVVSNLGGGTNTQHDYKIALNTGPHAMEEQVRRYDIEQQLIAGGEWTRVCSPTSQIESGAIPPMLNLTPSCMDKVARLRVRPHNIWGPGVPSNEVGGSSGLNARLTQTITVTVE